MLYEISDAICYMPGNLNKFITQDFIMLCDISAIRQFRPKCQLISLYIAELLWSHTVEL